jgi:hypothetical protein
VDKKRHLPIVLSLHERDRITILTAESDTSKWVYSIVNAADAKGNSTQLSNVIINGTNKADKTAPTVTGCQPRSGTSVPSLQPLLEVTFSEIIPLVNMNATIMEADSKTQIPFKILKSNGKTYQFQPEKPLNNYRSCVLTIETETCDLAGNGLKEPFKLVFLPISRPTQAK